MGYGLYLHIPYCKSRCRYCDFYTCGGAQAVDDAYINSLQAGFSEFAPWDESGAPLRPSSVYFGGGTPSLLTGTQALRLLQAANPLPGAEVTLEANPDSVSAEKLAGWRKAGVNRLSLGVQSARGASLRLLGRPHTAAQACRALQLARRAGFDNISGDIMLALPGYTEAEFSETLALIKDGGASHVSAYLLKVEPGTPLARALPPGLPGPDGAAAFYELAARRLAAEGYARYEISNFAQPGRESRHNLLYWKLGDWLGLGPGAHSCLAGRRFSFAPDVKSWLAAPQKQDEGAVCAEDAMMLGLRLADGLDLAALQARWGVVLSEKQLALLHRLETNGQAVRTAKGWALSTRGLLVQNSILSALLRD